MRGYLCVRREVSTVGVHAGALVMRCKSIGPYMYNLGTDSRAAAWLPNGSDRARAPRARDRDATRVTRTAQPLRALNRDHDDLAVNDRYS